MGSVSAFSKVMERSAVKGEEKRWLGKKETRPFKTSGLSMHVGEGKTNAAFSPPWIFPKQWQGKLRPPDVPVSAPMLIFECDLP